MITTWHIHCLMGAGILTVSGNKILLNGQQWYGRGVNLMDPAMCGNCVNLLANSLNQAVSEVKRRLQVGNAECIMLSSCHHEPNGMEKSCGSKSEALHIVQADIQANFTALSQT